MPIDPQDPHSVRDLYIQIRRVEEELAVLRRFAERVLPPDLLFSAASDAFEQQFPTRTIYHITPAAYYESCPATQDYLPSQYQQDGFIHCTRGADLMVMVANRHYRDVPGEFLMLSIDVQALKSPLKYESFDPVLPFPFPHIYGAINRDAIVAVLTMRRDDSGVFLVPPFPDNL
ncbi:MAG: DUF952 domain-containing protein [Chloroflexota bacterium]